MIQSKDFDGKDARSLPILAMTWAEFDFIALAQQTKLQYQQRMIRYILSALVAHATAWSPRCSIGFTLHRPVRKVVLRTIYRNHGIKDCHQNIRVARSDNDLFKCDESPDRDLGCDVEAGSRRSFIKFASLSVSGIISSGPMSLHLTGPENSNAMGLVTFPCSEGSLMNKYHIMRAGQSLLEEENILSTNPLFL